MEEKTPATMASQAARILVLESAISRVRVAVKVELNVVTLWEAPLSVELKMSENGTIAIRAKV